MHYKVCIPFSTLNNFFYKGIKTKYLGQISYVVSFYIACRFLVKKKKSKA